MLTAGDYKKNNYTKVSLKFNVQMKGKRMKNQFLLLATLSLASICSVQAMEDLEENENEGQVASGAGQVGFLSRLGGKFADTWTGHGPRVTAELEGGTFGEYDAVDQAHRIDRAIQDCVARGDGGVAMMGKLFDLCVASSVVIPDAGMRHAVEFFEGRGTTLFDFIKERKEGVIAAHAQEWLRFKAEVQRRKAVEVMVAARTGKDGDCSDDEAYGRNDDLVSKMLAATRAGEDG